MKHSSICIATALAATLAIGLMAGCSSQPASSASVSAESASAESASAEASASAPESASASAAVEQTQDELIAEFKDALAKTPEFKSVTVSSEESTTLASEGSSDEEPYVEKTVYKFDASGDQLKTSAEAEISDMKLGYITEGDKAVFISDGPVYSGTPEQFALISSEGVEAYLDYTIGDLNVLADCAANVEKMASNGLTFYTLTLDPQKYIDSDEILQVLAESGSPVKEALVTIGFEEDGSICSIDKKVAFEDLTKLNNLVFSDYDNTTVEAMPEADKTYEEMEADMQEKLDALSDELDMAEGLEDEASSAEAAEAK